MVDVPRRDPLLDPTNSAHQAARLRNMGRTMLPRSGLGGTKWAQPVLPRETMRAGARSIGGRSNLSAEERHHIQGWAVNNDTTATFALDFVPLPGSWNLELNSARVHRSEFTIAGQTLTITSPADLFKGVATQAPPWDLEIQFDYRAGVPATPLGDYVGEVMADGPWLYWRGLDSAYPVMPDHSGNSRNGTWNGGLYATHGLPTIVPTVSDGKSVDGFLGPTAPRAERPAYSGADNGQLNGTSLTVEIWCKPASIPQPGEHATGGLIDMGTANGPIVTIGGFGNPTNRLGFFIRGVDIGANVATTDVQHVVATYNATSGAMRLYRNNVLVASGTAPTGGLSDASGFSCGANYNGLRNFDGPYQEVALYTSELSADRVSAHYTAGIGS